MRTAPASSLPAAFSAAYQRRIDRWPIPVESLTVPTTFGDTHLLASGVPQGGVVLLLPGGGATATAWSAVAGGLGAGRRVVAVDPLGQPGRSVPSEHAMRTQEDVARWCGELLDRLDARQADLVGHSYGAWMALAYAIRSPQRVRRLALLDPTDCFAPLGLVYRLRAIPQLIRPRPAFLRWLLDWETASRPLQPEWLELVTSATACGRMRMVLPRQPRTDELARMRVPTLVVVAGHSRAHDPATVARRARLHLPDVKVVELPGATHHTIPTEDTTALVAVLRKFLDADSAAS